VGWLLAHVKWCYAQPASNGRLNRYYRLAPLSCRNGAAMVCAEKTKLQDVFAAAIDRHAKTVKSLHSTTGRLSAKP
jgi:hypothetical protein